MDKVDTVDDPTTVLSILALHKDVAMHFSCYQLFLKISYNLVFLPLIVLSRSRRIAYLLLPNVFVFILICKISNH